MTLDELLAELERSRVSVSADGDRLIVRAPEGAVTPALRDALSRHKPELLRRREAPAAATARIPREVRAGPLPLSFAQQRLWLLDQLGAGVAYNIPWALRLVGRLDVNALAASLNEIVRRHEALRTTFAAVDGRPSQIVAPEMRVALPLVDVGGSTDGAGDDLAVQARRLAVEEALRPFDLSRGPLVRATLVRLGEAEHVLVLNIHHIVFDGWSVGVFTNELAAHYSGFAAGSRSRLPDPPVQYADFAQWQRRWLQGDTLDAQLGYWKERLGGAPPQLELPADRRRPAVQTFRGAAHSFPFPAGLVETLRKLGQRDGATLFMVLLAGFKALLHRYTGHEDIVVGSPIANRSRAELEGLIGFFVNTLAMRTDLSGDPTFRDLVVRVRDVAHGAFEHEDLPFERLVDELNPLRDANQNPLFQVVFALQNAPRGLFDLPGLTVSPFEMEAQVTRFDLEFHLFESDDRRDLTALLLYSTDLFDAATVQRLGRHYVTLLESAARRPSARLSELGLLTKAESRQVVREWNATDRDYAREAGIAPVFEAQARRTPDAEAVVFRGERLSYGELDRRSNQLARHLRSLGVGPEVMVGICLERSVEMAVGLLGILKAGGAYVPLDPSYPPDRVAFMLQDSAVQVLLTQEGLSLKLQGQAARLLCLDRDWADVAKESTEPLASGVTGDNLAYVIYTSGSTGIPKGVAVPQRAVNRLVLNTDYVRVEASDRIAQASSASFDAATFEVWGALLNGACLVGISRDTALSPRDLGVTLKENGVTVLFLTTALFNAVAREDAGAFSDLRHLLFGGEAVDPRWVAEVLGSGPPGRLLHVYGPTETTTYATWHWVRKVDEAALTIPIGGPLANTRAYVLDPHGNPVPVGVPGELYLGGDGVARGYLNRPELTAAKFVPDPFGMESGGRLYRTGDVVRYGADGAIEFLSRIDNQVKVRGFRMELGEIESVLGQHPGVRESVVVVREDVPGDRRLVAYVVQGADLGRRGTEQWSAGRVAQWQKTYDTVIYDGVAAEGDSPADPAFNIAGWNSSYTGAAIPAEQMREQVEQTVERIARFSPGRVLEIGCGTGLLLFRLAPRGRRYVGTDFSQVSLDYVHRHLGTLGTAAAGVELQRRTADDFDGIERGQFDAVVLNSVIQYFPGMDYLVRVLEGAIEALAPGGFVFLGDVRNLALLEAFHAAVQLHQAPPSLTSERLRQRVEQQLRQEQELVVEPAFFTALKRHLPRISQVHVQPKRGLHHNELTQFRYDVVLRVGGEAPTAAEHPWVDCREAFSVSGIRQRLLEEAPAALGLCAVPNARVAAAAEAWRMLGAGSSPATAGELRDAARGAAGIDPEEIWGLSRHVPYSVDISWAASRKDGAYDVLFRRQGTAESANFPEAPSVARAWAEYGSDPVQGTLARGLVPQLRNHLAEKLPEYMVPSTIVLLESLPLNANGKVDRRALPAPGGARPELDGAYVAPRSPVEEALAGIWCDVLGLERVGVNDNFFQLGGDSILSIQIVSRANRIGLGLTPRQLFQHQTVGALAAVASEAGRGQADQGIVAGESPLTLAQKWKLDERTLERVVGGREVDDIYPLTPMQEGMLFHTLMSPESGAYAEQAEFDLEGPLDGPAFRSAWDRLVERHAILRTNFCWEGLDRPVQVVERGMPLPWRQEDWREFSREEQAKRCEAFLRADRERGFDLARGPLMRVAVLRLAAERHRMVWTFHHALLDGWCLPLVLSELLALYRGFKEGRVGEPPRPRPYRDYLVWLEGQDLGAAETYWREELKGFTTPTSITTGRVAAIGGEGGAGELEFGLTEEATAALRAMGRAHGVTLNTIVQGAWAVLLSRYSGEPDVLFGVTVSGRPAGLPGVETMVGLFINTLPLRVQVVEDQPLAAWLQAIQSRQVDQRQYEYSPLSQVQKWSEVGAGQALFETLVVFENYPSDPLRRETMGDLRLETRHLVERTNYPLTIKAIPADGLRFVITHDEARYDRDTIERLSGHFTRLLEGMGAGAEGRLRDLPLLTQSEEVTLLERWNATAKAYPPEATIADLFEAQVDRTPEALALTFQGQSLTYAELNRQANRLARHLRALGVRPETRVAICMERSLEMVVGLLGILKAGAAYVPLDPGYPESRLAFMRADAEVGVLLTQDRLVERLPAGEARIVRLDAEAEAIATNSDGNLGVRVAPGNLAYVIYTSGSTGRPKGAMNTHAAVCNRLLWMQDEYGLGEGDAVLQKTPFSFDVSVWEFFWPLLVGARLVVARPEGHKDSAYLASVIEREGITTVHFVPSMLRAFLEEPALSRLDDLRRVICSGEVLPFELQERFFSRLGAELHNLYGPTEAAVDVTRWACRRDDERRVVPIGFPIANTRTHVLDGAMRPVPIGVVGELYLGGVQVGRGYLNRPDLTAERFVPDSVGAEPGLRLYRTGDLARVLSDGSIEYVGRMDHQVKVRGFRIELGEIEAELSGHPGVRDVAVVARRDESGDGRLVAYVVGDVGGSELRTFLKARLPEYMVPSAFIALEALPLSPNGKLDRGALPAPDRSVREERERVPARTPAEVLLAAIWAGVLRVPVVGTTDNFFELGGDSILSLQVVARANAAGLGLSLKQLFEHQTVGELAALAHSGAEVDAEQGPVLGEAPLTPVQQWFFEQDLEEAHHFNQALILEVDPHVSPEIIERAVGALERHHDALRLRYRRRDGGWRQEIVEAGEPPFVRVDLEGTADRDISHAMTEVVAALQASLDLQEGPIWRVAHVGLGRGHCGRLLIAVHHLAVDGVSWRILLEDLQSACDQAGRGEPIRLPRKTTSFRSWAEKLCAHAAQFRAELGYWRSLSEAGRSDLPVDQALTPDANTAGSSSTFTLRMDAAETRALVRDVPSAYPTSAADLLLTAVLQALEEWSGRQGVAVDVEGHGREPLFEDVDLSRTVGWFTTIHPVRVGGIGGRGPAEALARAKAELSRVPRRGIGYGVLRYLDSEAKAGFHGIAGEVCFNYLGQFDSVVDGLSTFRLAQEDAGPLRSPKGRRRYLLDVTARVLGGRLEVQWTYSNAAHRRTTVEALAYRFQAALRDLIEHCLSAGAGAGGEQGVELSGAELSGPDLAALIAGLDGPASGAGT